MNKKILMPAIAISLIFSAYAMPTTGKSTFKKVKSGEYSLICIMPDGERVISPDMVTRFDPDFGWTFTNGSAKNCQVIK